MGYKDPEKQKAYQREWYRKRREAYFADKSCVRCTSKVDLHLHHKDPEAKVSHKIWSWSEERREQELAKCEPVCASCHLGDHAEEKKKHGGIGRYEAGCRCIPCKEAKAIKNRRYRDSVRQRASIAQR